MNVRSDGERPKISVIIPAYNHESYILDAVRSVLQQTFTNLELIIIDDGSTDGTLSRIQSVQDGRIRVFHQDNQGAAKTINRGIGLARGKYLSILNSDDLYTPDRLKTLATFLDEHADVALASSLIQPVDSSGKPVLPYSRHAYWLEWYDNAIRQFHQDRSPVTSLLKYNFFVSTSNIFVRSTIFKHERMFHENLSYCHDYEFLLRVLSRHSFHLCEERLLMYRLHETNTIRENEFLRHLEVLFAIFTVLDMRKFFLQSLPERISSPVFKGLSENPEINPRLQLAESDRCLKDFQSQIVELHRRLEAADGSLSDLQGEISKRDLRLSEADRCLKDFQDQIIGLHRRLEEADGSLSDLQDEISKRDLRLTEADTWLRAQLTQIQDQQVQIQNQHVQIENQQVQIENQQVQIETKDRILQEIYSSRGWRFLTRYRAVKHRLSFWKKLPPSVREDVSCEHTDRKDNHSERQDKPYHASIIHPVQQDRIKVVHAIANFMMGGSSRLVVDLFEHLGHKYDQEVIAYYVPPVPAYTGIKIHNFYGDVSEKDIAVFLRKNGTSILHVHYWGDCDEPWYRKVFAAAGNSSCLVIENINTPVATYIHDRIDQYVYVSDYAMHFTQPVSGKSTVIYPGSNFTLFQRHGAAVPDDVIGMVYRIEPDKLREDSIQVFIEVVKRRPQTKVYIVGGGTLLPYYRQRVTESGLADRFVFTDYVPYEQLPDYYRKFSLFVAPVWKESFGQVSPFAMSMEIPVVGYDVGALSEILGGKDCLGKNTAELTEIIINLLDDRKRRMDIGKANRARAIEKFSVDTMIRQYDDLYARLLVQQRTGHIDL
jgi:glycosyltransferase involved in cell wall biosynthesis